MSKIFLQEIKYLLLKSSGQEKMISYQKEDLKDKVHIIKITFQQLLKKIKVINPKDSFRLEENFKALQITLNNLIRKKV